MRAQRMKSHEVAGGFSVIGGGRLKSSNAKLNHARKKRPCARRRHEPCTFLKLFACSGHICLQLRLQLMRMSPVRMHRCQTAQHVDERIRRFRPQRVQCGTYDIPCICCGRNNSVLSELQRKRRVQCVVGLVFLRRLVVIRITLGPCISIARCVAIAQPLVVPAPCALMSDRVGIPHFDEHVECVCQILRAQRLQPLGSKSVAYVEPGLKPVDEPIRDKHFRGAARRADPHRNIQRRT